MIEEGKVGDDIQDPHHQGGKGKNVIEDNISKIMLEFEDEKPCVWW